MTLPADHTVHTGFDCRELRLVVMRGDTRVRTFAATLTEVSHPDDGVDDDAEPDDEAVD